MGDGCCRPDYDALFDARSAHRELSDFRRRGARGTTRQLLDAIRGEGVAGASLLDIGGGIGSIGIELLDAGAASLTDVDASGSYLAVASHELRRRGHGERVTLHHGNFVALAGEVAAADVVTLDRVICCYHDWEALVDRSLERARRLYGIVLPRDHWWMRLPIGAVRGVGRMVGRAYPFHVHPERAIDARIRAAGFEPILARRGWFWQALLYRRAAH